MRNSWMAVAALLCVASTARPVEESLWVSSAEVRFKGDTAQVRIEGGIYSAKLQSAFDPAVDPLRVTFGGESIVSLPEDLDRAVVKSDAYGDFEVRMRRPYEGRGSLRMKFNPGSGRFALKARGLDATALRELDSPSVPLEVVIGKGAQSTMVNFTARGSRRWTWKAPPVVPHGGGPGEPGGSGGSAGVPTTPPPPDTTPLQIIVLSQGQGSKYPSPAWVVCRNQSQLSAMWSQHSPGTAVPTVNFNIEVVVGDFAGDPSIWHTMYASWAERLNGGIQVHIYLHGTQGVVGHGTHSIFRLTRSDGAIVERAHWTIIGPR